MRLRIDSLIQLEPVSFELSCTEEALGLGDGPHLDGHLTVSGEATLSGRQVVVQATLTGAWTLSCGRCLVEYSSPIALPLEALFVPEDEASAPGDYEPGGEWSIEHYAGKVVDLSSAARETLLLGAPMQPLCRPSCRGICPQCGTDRNEQTCVCQAKRLDPRLAPLQRLVGRAN